MRVRLIVGILLLGAPLVFAQPAADELKTEGGLRPAPGASVSGRYRVGGPLAEAFKSQKTSLPGRLARLINPFAPAETPARTDTFSKVTPVAWSTRVGWSPGWSAFPDATRHEPKLVLVSVSRSPAR